ncbi:DUF3977 family protein [Paenibacillus flagellatus]|uniref:DUF3977 family protein n=1 Tax=Paenibacillus flagellatus TaxID=2211139 RepID=UPI001FEB821E|nr:DUF3977 family protein [Paenibacillus flagellatus]
MGFGNRWFVRTEFETNEGVEYELRGIHGPDRIDSVYVRLWIGRRVWIADARQGLRSYRKPGRKLKAVFGIRGTVSDSARPHK